MSPLPKLLVSSVVRGSRQGDSHGGVYLVDMESGSFEQMLDWNSGNINFEGRGADRGLRGIVFNDGHTFIAASDELFVFDQAFKIVASYRSPYLKHCHEISLHRGSLYLTSTGFDSILRLDLATGSFDLGLKLLKQVQGIGVKAFDPKAPAGPAQSIEFHINNVFVDDTGIFVSGRHLPALMRITPDAINLFTRIPLGTHNARPFQGGVLLNDTESDNLVFAAQGRIVKFAIPRYPDADLLCTDFDESGLARQAFGRGLCPITETLVAGGSSPTTVSVYDLGAEKRIASLNLTMDVRNAAHGLAVWPY